MFSVREARVRAQLRTLPPRLDRVIDHAKAVEEAEKAAQDAKAASTANRKSYRRGAGSDRKAGAHSGGLDATVSGSRGQHGFLNGSSSSSSGTVLLDTRGKPRERAQIVGNTRTMSFHASTAMFKGGRPAYNGSTHNYPYSLDANRLMLLMGAEQRAASLNGELRRAREAKYENDLRAMARLQDECEEAVKPQMDGQKLRLGRVATPDRWTFSGLLRRRGQIATWQWAEGFYVLCDGMLYEFTGSSLSSSIVAVWPVLGATARRGTPSSQAYPYVLELRISPHLLEEEILSTVELAASTKGERSKWIDALERESLKVSRIFRGTNEFEAYQAEVLKRASTTGEAPRSGRRSWRRHPSERGSGESSRRSRLSSRLSQLAGGILRRSSARRKKERASRSPAHFTSSASDGSRMGSKAPRSSPARGRQHGGDGEARGRDGNQAYLSARKAAPRMTRSPTRRGK